MRDKNFIDIIIERCKFLSSIYRKGAEKDVDWKMISGVVVGKMFATHRVSEMISSCVACDVLSLLSECDVMDVVLEIVGGCDSEILFDRYVKNFKGECKRDDGGFMIEYEGIVVINYGGRFNVCPSDRNGYSMNEDVVGRFYYPTEGDDILEMLTYTVVRSCEYMALMYRGEDNMEPNTGWTSLARMAVLCMPRVSDTLDMMSMCVACDVISMLSGYSVQEIMFDAMMDFNSKNFFMKYLKDLGIGFERNGRHFEFEYNGVRVVGSDGNFRVWALEGFFLRRREDRENRKGMEDRGGSRENREDGEDGESRENRDGGESGERLEGMSGEGNGRIPDITDVDVRNMSNVFDRGN